MNSFPINLFFRGRPALVVGGGKVAVRKVERLREAGAQVRVVATELRESLVELAAAGSIHAEERPFTMVDLDTLPPPLLVYAATDDRRLNREILDACQSRHILCCAVDDNWVHGDYLTPASVETGGITVAISTQGRSCVRSRIIKEAIAKHVDLVAEAELVIIGTDQRVLDLGQREPLHLPDTRRQRVGEMLTHLWGVHEVVVLNTCNRVEVCAIMSPREPVLDTVCRILDFDHLPRSAFYIHQGGDAFAHLAKLLAGLYSQIPGEKHVVSQAKQAWQDSADADWGGSLIDKVFDAAMFVSRRIRAVVEPQLHGLEIEDLALRYAQSRRPATVGVPFQAAVIGTGQVGTAVATALLQAGMAVNWCYHSQPPDCVAIAQPALRLFAWDAMAAAVAHADIVIGAVAGIQPILGLEQLPWLTAGGKPVVLLDLGMPRNFAPELDGTATGLELVNLETLKHWYREEVVDLRALLAAADAVIVEHADRCPVKRDFATPTATDHHS